jgi:hypothetical protein
MNSNLAHGLWVITLAAGVMSVPVAAETTLPFEGLKDAPMEPYHNSDGTFRRFRNTIVTGYWSGYAVTASAPCTGPRSCDSRSRVLRCIPADFEVGSDRH